MQTVKRPLKKVLGQALLTVQELYTVLTEVESLVNQRPLTYQGDVYKEPLISPAMLLGDVWHQEPQSADASLVLMNDTNQAAKRVRYIKEVVTHLKH